MQPSGRGAVIEARFADGVWYRGRLVKRLPGVKPPRWRVRFDDGEVRDDICLDSEHTPVRFDAAAYHAVVEVQYDGSWYRGRLVELIKGSVVWGVAFEDGDWAEDVRLGDTDVRYISAEGGRGQVRAGRKRRRVDGAASHKVKLTAEDAVEIFALNHMRRGDGGKMSPPPPKEIATKYGVTDKTIRGEHAPGAATDPFACCPTPRP